MTLKGKLRKSVTYDYQKGNFQLNIMDSINIAEKQLEKIKDLSELELWKKEWFGTEE